MSKSVREPFDTKCKQIGDGNRVLETMWSVKVAIGEKTGNKKIGGGDLQSFCHAPAGVQTGLCPIFSKRFCLAEQTFPPKTMNGHDDNWHHAQGPSCPSKLDKMHGVYIGKWIFTAKTKDFPGHGKRNHDWPIEGAHGEIENWHKNECNLKVSPESLSPDSNVYTWQDDGNLLSPETNAKGEAGQREAQERWSRANLEVEHCQVYTDAAKRARGRARSQYVEQGIYRILRKNIFP